MSGDSLRALFEQHPLPWVKDDNRDGYVGLVTVFDANGRSIVITGDMESCTAGDILLAQFWAAAPELLAACNAAYHALRSYQHGNSTPDLAMEIADLLCSAIAKARGTNEA